MFRCRSCRPVASVWRGDCHVGRAPREEHRGGLRRGCPEERPGSSLAGGGTFFILILSRLGLALLSPCQSRLCQQSPEDFVGIEASIHF